MIAAAPPPAIVARYESAVAALNEPRTFTVEFTLEQSGNRTVDQTHRIFRVAGDERDETLAVNGTKAVRPSVRIFHGRPYRYAATKLAPRTAQYAFTFLGPRKNGHHVDYVFRVEPKVPSARFAFTQVEIDGITYLPSAVTFSGGPGTTGSVTFAKSDRYWVATSANASAKTPGGTTHERLTFTNWKFPKTLPKSTFAAAKPLPTSAPLPPG
ncbi:MAG TPA: hypothetical protein VGN14_04710 [Candidatus Elarobacter sp.]|jgi:hypothetical protein